MAAAVLRQIHCLVCSVEKFIGLRAVLAKFGDTDGDSRRARQLRLVLRQLIQETLEATDGLLLVAANYGDELVSRHNGTRRAPREARWRTPDRC